MKLSLTEMSGWQGCEYNLHASFGITMRKTIPSYNNNNYSINNNIQYFTSEPSKQIGAVQ